MRDLTDRAYLRDEQYRDGRNLDARVRLVVQDIRSPEAAALLRRLARLNCGIGLIPSDLGIRDVVVHGGLYRASPLVAASCLERAEASLRRQGWREVAREGPVVRYARPGS